MRALKALGAALGFLVLLVGAGAFLLDRYLHSAAFREAVLGAARDALGADVRIGDLRVSLWSGATLDHVAVSAPGFPGDLLTAEALVFRYRLLPLLRRRLELEEVSLERPLLRLARGETGEWNYERLGARPVPAPPPRPAPRRESPGEATPPPAGAPGAGIVVPRLTVTGGEVLMMGDRERVLARVRGLDLRMAVARVGGVPSGSGTASIDTLSLADTLAVKRLRTPIAVAAGEVHLDPLVGKLADGDVRGSVALKLAGASRYTVNVQVASADVERVLREAGARHRRVGGTLTAALALEGTGGLSTLAGRGSAEIRDGALIDVPTLSLLALLLQMPALRELRFEECRLELAVADGVLRTPVIRLVARDVQITGRGSVSLETGALDHDLTLAVARRALARAPREIRRAFAERPDGMMALDFRVWGPYEAPKTDLQDRVLKGVTEQILRRGLKQLFK